MTLFVYIWRSLHLEVLCSQPGIVDAEMNRTVAQGGRSDLNNEDKQEQTCSYPQIKFPSHPDSNQ